MTQNMTYTTSKCDVQSLQIKLQWASQTGSAHDVQDFLSSCPASLGTLNNVISLFLGSAFEMALLYHHQSQMLP